MFQSILLSAPVTFPGGPVSSFLEPIATATPRHSSVSDALADVVHDLGFEHFAYWTSSSPAPTKDTRSYIWSNLPLAWIERYNKMAYIEVDPRVTDASAADPPKLWDRDSFPDSERTREFFDDAARYGLCTGVAVAWRDPSRTLSGFDLTSAQPRLDDELRAHCARHQGEILLLAGYVHAMIKANVFEGKQLPPLADTPTTAREREILQLAAKGLASSEIAICLGIGVRTVQVHMKKLLANLDKTSQD